jgi:hypothetical protein
MEHLPLRVALLAVLTSALAPDRPVTLAPNSHFMLQAGAHLWLDLEVFDFEKETGALIPRPVEGLISDLTRFRNFEKVLCLEYTGLLNEPGSLHPPGGPATTKLWQDYQIYLDKRFPAK